MPKCPNHSIFGISLSLSKQTNYDCLFSNCFEIVVGICYWMLYSLIFNCHPHYYESMASYASEFTCNHNRAHLITLPWFMTGEKENSELWVFHQATLCCNNQWTNTVDYRHTHRPKRGSSQRGTVIGTHHTRVQKVSPPQCELDTLWKESGWGGRNVGHICFYYLISARGSRAPPHQPSSFSGLAEGI